LSILKKTLALTLVLVLFNIVVNAEQYTIKEGDTLIEIAAANNTTPLELSVANNIDLKDNLIPGQRILITRVVSNPETIPAISYTVKKGDTISSIARRYGLTSTKLASMNGISIRTKLNVNKVLSLIPKSTFKPDIKTSDSTSSIANMALRYRGARYALGASSRGGFDCSGFTSYIYRQHGKIIPRNSASQFAAGKPISRENLKEGDIVCFSTYRSGCSHVGIYVGNNKFMHAANSRKGVILSSLNESYYASRYLGARRY